MANQENNKKTTSNSEEVEKPKARRGRPPKTATASSKSASSTKASNSKNTESATSIKTASKATPKKAGPKSKTEKFDKTAALSEPVDKPKPRRGRPPKASSTEDSPSTSKTANTSKPRSKATPKKASTAASGSSKSTANRKKGTAIEESNAPISKRGIKKVASSADKVDEHPKDESGNQKVATNTPTKSSVRKAPAKKSTTKTTKTTKPKSESSAKASTKKTGINDSPSTEEKEGVAIERKTPKRAVSKTNKTVAKAKPTGPKKVEEFDEITEEDSKPTTKPRPKPKPAQKSWIRKIDLTGKGEKEVPSDIIDGDLEETEEDTRFNKIEYLEGKPVVKKANRNINRVSDKSSNSKKAPKVAVSIDQKDKSEEINDSGSGSDLIEESEETPNKKVITIVKASDKNTEVDSKKTNETDGDGDTQKESAKSKESSNQRGIRKPKNQTKSKANEDNISVNSTEFEAEPDSEKREETDDQTTNKKVIVVKKSDENPNEKSKAVEHTPDSEPTKSSKKAPKDAPKPKDSSDSIAIQAEQKSVKTKADTQKTKNAPTKKNDTQSGSKNTNTDSRNNRSKITHHSQSNTKEPLNPKRDQRERAIYRYSPSVYSYQIQEVNEHKLLDDTERKHPFINAFLKKISSYMRESLYVDIDVKIILAVSGGIDSVVLTDAMAILSQEYHFKFELAHYNHKMRDGSDKDENFVRQLANSYRVGFHAGSGNVKKLSDESGMSLEEAARHLRYGFLNKVIQKTDSDFIATAHNSNDSAETLLMNLMRGSGLTGLSGIPPKRPIGKNSTLIRPFLDVTRDEIEKYASIRKIFWVEDITNRSLDFTRNRIRHNVIPFLEENFNPKLVETLHRTTQILRGADTFLRDKIKEHADLCLDSHSKGSIKLKKGIFASFTDFVKGEILQYLFNRHFDLIPLPSKQLDKIIRLPNTAIGSRAEVSKEITAINQRESLLISDFVDYDSNHDPVKIDATGDYQLGSYSYKVEKLKGENFDISSDDDIEFFDTEYMPKTITLRYWKEGDKIVPLGMKGSMSVSDYLTNIKTEPADRSKIAVLTDGVEIIWICGHRISDKYKLQKSTKEVLKISRSESESSNEDVN